MNLTSSVGIQVGNGVAKVLTITMTTKVAWRWCLSNCNFGIGIDACLASNHGRVVVFLTRIDDDVFSLQLQS